MHDDRLYSAGGVVRSTILGGHSSTPIAVLLVQQVGFTRLFDTVHGPHLIWNWGPLCSTRIRGRCSLNFEGELINLYGKDDLWEAFICLVPCGLGIAELPQCSAHPLPLDTPPHSGAEAIDNAIKIARSFTGRPNIICFDVSDHIDEWCPARPAVARNVSVLPVLSLVTPRSRSHFISRSELSPSLVPACVRVRREAIMGAQLVRWRSRPARPSTDRALVPSCRGSS